MPISDMRLTQKVKAGEISRADALATLKKLNATDTRSYRRIMKFKPEAPPK